jgi:hypothetical protein
LEDFEMLPEPFNVEEEDEDDEEEEEPLESDEDDDEESIISIKSEVDSSSV